MIFSPKGEGQWISYITHIQEVKKKHKGTLATPFDGVKPIEEAVHAMGWRESLSHLLPATMVWFQDEEGEKGSPSLTPGFGSHL